MKYFFDIRYCIFSEVWYNTSKEDGLVSGPGSTCGGDVPAIFFRRSVNDERTQSIR